MPEKKRYWELKSKGICTECAKREATNNTRCLRCYTRKIHAQVLEDVIEFSWLDYENLKQKCNGHCQICNRELKLVLDHCHQLKKVRGLLCDTCNRGLGLFRDNVKWLQTAIDYLNEFGSRQSRVVK